MLPKPETTTVEQLPQLAECAAVFYAASRFLKDFDMARFVALWTDLLQRDVGVIYSQRVDGRLVGTIGGILYPETYSGKPVATEFFWFVLPEFRGAGLQLYHAFEDWARMRGAMEIRMIHLMDSMPQKLERVYTHLGFVPAEVHYVKPLSL